MAATTSGINIPRYQHFRDINILYNGSASKLELTALLLEPAFSGVVRLRFAVNDLRVNTAIAHILG